MNQSTCSIDSCEKPVLGRGWCNMHYSRWRRNGDVNDPGRKVRYCTIDGCESPRLSHGLCNMHRLRRNRGQSNLLEPNPVRTYADGCKVPGCGREHCGLGYCEMHVQRVRKHGSAGSVGVIRWAWRTCSHEGCGKPYHAHGFCSFHNAHSGAEAIRECSRCGDDIDMMKVSPSGRKQHGSTLMCKPCRAARSTRAKWSAKAIAAVTESDACAICGDPVDFSIRHPDLWCGSVDHIVPVARGGSHDLSNLQLAHLVCNMRKGANLDYALVPQCQ